MVNEIQNKLKQIENNSSISEFLTGFLLSYGTPKATLVRLGLESSVPVNQEIVIGNTLCCMYTTATNLYARFDQFQRFHTSNKIRFEVLLNDCEMLALDTAIGEWLSIPRNKIHTEFEFFLPLIGFEKSVNTEKNDASISIGEKFAHLNNELLLLNPERKEDIGVLLVNLIASLFGDSCGILRKGTVSNYIELFSKKDGSDLNLILKQIFNALQGLSEVPEYLQERCYGRIEGISHYDYCLKFNADSRKTIISICNLNWDAVEPEVIGAIIQAIVNPEESSLSYNYTSTANVYKVIGPLFMDDLFEDYEQKKSDCTLTADFLDVLSNIHVFDPSCGTGNFLIVCYRELKKLENLVKKYCDEHSISYANNAYVQISSFYGIDRNSIATEVCRIGLAFTERKISESSLKNILLPNKSICNNDALKMDWKSFCPCTDRTFIVGNPSYKGSHSMDEEQQKTMKLVYEHELAKGFKIGNLDYVTAYFYKATEYIKESQNGFAFVSTNSLTQGIHVPTLWPLLFSKGVAISFAYTSFKWKNEGRNTTAVTVVIIGCRSAENGHVKTIYDKNLAYTVDSITPYLTKGGRIVEKEDGGPISSILPKMVKGNMPYGKGLLLKPQEKNELVKTHPSAGKFLKRVVGSEEFIHGKERWCLWIEDEKVSEALSIPPIKERIESVRSARLGGDKSAQKLAERPHQFRETNMPEKYTLVVPSVSSENRVYMQIGYVSRNVVVTNLAFAIYDAEPWVFGLISSKMHNLWIRTVCGGLETRLRYSNVLGYNTFPVPYLSAQQLTDINEAALGVLIERENSSELSLMELYNPDTMPAGLLYAHRVLDEVVERCYKAEGFISNQERLNEMFELYSTIKGIKV